MLVTISGNTAQCMAQASEVAAPNPSQFIFIFMKQQRYYICTAVATFLTPFNAAVFYVCISGITLSLINCYKEDEKNVLDICWFFCSVIGSFLPAHF